LRNLGIADGHESGTVVKFVQRKPERSSIDLSNNFRALLMGRCALRVENDRALCPLIR
jgi:hypothetical protein